MGQVVSKGKTLKIAQSNEAEEELKRKKQWLESLTFSDLPSEGREAFIEFTKERKYNDHTRRLEFWYSTPEEKALKPLLSKYLTDGVNQLPEVTADDDVDEIIGMSSKIDSYVSNLKELMRPKLNEVFKEFKVCLKREIESKS